MRAARRRRRIVGRCLRDYPAVQFVQDRRLVLHNQVDHRLAAGLDHRLDFTSRASSRCVVTHPAALRRSWGHAVAPDDIFRLRSDLLAPAVDDEFAKPVSELKSVLRPRPISPPTHRAPHLPRWLAFRALEAQHPPGASCLPTGPPCKGAELLQRAGGRRVPRLKLAKTLRSLLQPSNPFFLR